MESFFKRIEPLLSAEDFEKFKNEYKNKGLRGVRVNTLKCSIDKFFDLTEGEGIGEVTPFCKWGFYLEENADFSGKHPLHHAGAVYFQEPSAMSAVTLLCPEKGERVLDLCAAPGGKSTQIAACLQGEGLLWCNEYVRSRSTILLSNIERCGVRNAVISSCDPETLCEKLSGFFDKVLVDAPCSGEGMFRKEPQALTDWSAEHSDSCADRQFKILESAKKALRAGGELVYSTCTFSEAENEGVLRRFLEANPDFELVNTEESFGVKGKDRIGVRIFPFHGGEGHFAVKLRKREDSPFFSSVECEKVTPLKNIPKCAAQFFESTFYDTSMLSRALLREDKLYILPADTPALKGVGVIRGGVFAGEVRKNYFEPAHALFMSEKPENIRQVLSLNLSDERVKKYLHGEEIPVDEKIKGYCAVCVEGIVMGFGKVSGGMLKNKYPKGLRIM